MDDTEKPDTIAKIADRLAARYPEAPRPLVDRIVAEEYGTLGDSRIRTYIPTLVEHRAKDRLNRGFDAQSAEL
ncbi:three-helix bundle dimerization domain-containing protein [Arthrobacter oryzae]|uniref:three-helix bundle dimerization domain-containing protein n=1 Tax=Arthrobacter oryzae TaxID=409290 RepID=UPI0030C8E605